MVTTPLQKLIRCRDGAMIALLALLPIRRRSLCELSLGQSVYVTNSSIVISLSADMMKFGVPWEAAVPPQVEPLLRHYIDEVRPVLLSRGGVQHDSLWVGKKGEILGLNGIGSRIGNLTLALTGKRVPPHLFRDAAATTLARISPESARLIAPVLAHSSKGTAERHYIHADGLRTAGLKDKLESLEARCQEIEAKLGQPEPTPVRLHPQLSEIYRRKVEELSGTLANPLIRPMAMDVLRGLITSVTIHETDEGVTIDLEGAIKALVGLAQALVMWADRPRSVTA